MQAAINQDGILGHIPHNYHIGADNRPRSDAQAAGNDRVGSDEDIIA
jgi:hypothetical protein